MLSAIDSKKPPAGAGIYDPAWDWARKKMLRCWSLQSISPSQIFDIHNGGEGTIQEGVHVSTPHGIGMRFDAATDTGVTLPDDLLTDQVSVVALVKTDVSSTTGDGNSGHIMGRFPGWFMSRRGSTEVLRIAIDTGSSTSVDIASESEYVGKYVVAGASYNGATIRTFFNGQFKNSSAKTGNMDMTGETRLGTYYGGGTGNAWDGDIVISYLFKEALTDEEQYLIGNDIFGPIRTIDYWPGLFVAAAAGGTQYPTGSLSLLGVGL